MYKPAAVRAMLLTTSLSGRVLMTGLVGMLLVSVCLTARAESASNQLTPAEIQKKVRVGDKIIVTAKDWFVIGSEKYKVFQLQVTQITSATVIGKRVEASSGVSGEEGAVSIPLEQIETVERQREVSAMGGYVANHFKCYFGLFPAIALYPIPVPMREPAACSKLRLSLPDPSGLP